MKFDDVAKEVIFSTISFEALYKNRDEFFFLINRDELYKKRRK